MPARTENMKNIYECTIPKENVSYIPMTAVVMPMTIQTFSRNLINLIAFSFDMDLFFYKDGSSNIFDLEISEALVGFKTISPNDLFGCGNFHKHI